MKKSENPLILSFDLEEWYHGRWAIGFRAPNLIVPDWLFPILVEQGLINDSSICPSRKLFGKYQGQFNLPL